MSSEHSYARRGRNEPLHEPFQFRAPASWSDHELWQRAGESANGQGTSRIPRVEHVVEPNAAAAALTVARDECAAAEAAPAVAPAAEIPVLDAAVAEVPVGVAPVGARTAVTDAVKPVRRAGPPLHRRREIGRSLFRTFDTARRRCGGRAGTRIGGF